MSCQALVSLSPAGFSLFRWNRAGNGMCCIHTYLSSECLCRLVVCTFPRTPTTSIIIIQSIPRHLNGKRESWSLLWVWEQWNEMSNSKKSCRSLHASFMRFSCDTTHFTRTETHFISPTSSSTEQIEVGKKKGSKVSKPFLATSALWSLLDSWSESIFSFA